MNKTYETENYYVKFVKMSYTVFKKNYRRADAYIEFKNLWEAVRYVDSAEKLKKIMKF
jgi:hypothetical protein